MLLDLVKQYPELIQEVEVERWKEVKTFPHHRPVERESQVEFSQVHTLEDVLKFVRERSQGRRRS